MTEITRKHLYPWIQWRNNRFWILVILMLCILFGFFGVPHIVRNVLTTAIEDTGRSIEIAAIQSNPLALSLTVTGLQIKDADTTTITRFDEFYANFELSSLFYRAWTFADLEISGLHVEEERFDIGDTRWLRLIDDLKPPPANTPVEEGKDAPPRVIIHHLVIDDGSIGVRDQLAGGFHSEFGPVSVVINDLRTLPEHSGENEVSIVTPAGGVISWKGDLQVVPLASSGQFTVRGKGLPAALQYADHLLPISIEGEHLEVNFDYSLRVDDSGPSLEVDNLVTKTGQIDVRMDDDDENFLSLSGIHLDGGSLRIPERTFNANSLTLNGIRLDAWMNQEGRLSLLDALPPKDDAVGTDAPEKTSLPDWQINLDRVALDDANISFEDHRTTIPGLIEVSDLDLTLENVSNEADAEAQADLSLSLESGGIVAYTGEVTALPELSLQGRISGSEVDLGVIQPWLAEQARVELNSGTLSFEADVSGNPAGSLLVSGSTRLDSLELRDANRNQRLAGLDSFSVEQFEFDMAAQSLRTSTLDLKGAFGRIHIFEDLSTNVGDLMVERAAPEQDSSTSGSLDLSVGGIDITHSSLDFADDSLPLPFQALIRDLNGSVSTLSSSSSEPTRVELDGQVNEFGEATISGTLTPLDITQNSDIDMVFRNLQMSNLTPYTIQYAGYAIESGRLDMDLGYRFDQRMLQGDNNIVIRQLELGDKVEHPEAADLPLKLAVALLKDSEGVIDVDLPVSGDLDDPAFKISGVVWSAIGNLITRVVTSPFRFLGNLVGVDSEDFGTLSFQAGESNVSPPDREQLLKLAEAMQQRPELEISIEGVFAEALDRQALQAQAVEAQLEAMEAELLESGAADVLTVEMEALEALFSRSFPDTLLETVRPEFTQVSESDVTPTLDEPAYLAYLRSRLVEAQDIGTEELTTLASGRAQAIASVLETAGADTSRITVSADTASGDVDEGSVLLNLGVTVGE